ncbi:DNA-binding protein [Pseudomonas petrae]|uniref:DNA-binding protein n=1 Tax=Pseudomonas petrae TaxID=2912190 RepID=UPI001EEFFFB3|nr:DNA-binding protein [Pseudomonas petrae]MCF7532267.1 DNA-binding protein [Pseudomonas petrae]MCF7535897.1 DNA-binding protein [Pseudomonas petrae]
MARGGINKAVVERARQALLSKGAYPSIDAVRVELGNTGSKTTIARYLKELDGQAPAEASPRERMSHELRALVEALLDRLTEEGAEVVAQAQAEFDRQRDAWRTRLEALELELDTARRQCESQHAALTEQGAQLLTTHSSWQSELTRNAGLSQQCQDLERRVQDKDVQIQSLEEKHVHARAALEHYREAIKEQREQDQRRHEAQLQQIQVEQRKLQETLVIKQDESTRLNRDNERLLGEMRQQARALTDQQDQTQRLATELRTAQMATAKADGAREQLQEQLAVIQVESKSLAKVVALANEQLAQADQRVAVLSEDNDSLRAQVQLIIATPVPIQT